MKEETLEWLERKQKFAELMLGNSEEQEYKDFAYEQMREVVKLEKELFQVNYEMEQLRVRREVIVAKIRTQVQLVESVVSKAEEVKQSKNGMEVR